MDETFVIPVKLRWPGAMFTLREIFYNGKLGAWRDSGCQEQTAKNGSHAPNPSRYASNRGDAAQRQENGAPCSTAKLSFDGHIRRAGPWKPIYHCSNLGKNWRDRKLIANQDYRKYIALILSSPAP